MVVGASLALSVLLFCLTDKMKHWRPFSSPATAVAILCLVGCCLDSTTNTAAAEPNYFGANHVIPPARSFSSANCYRSVPSCSHFKSASSTGAFQCLDVSLPYRQTFPPVAIAASPPPAQHHNSGSGGGEHYHHHHQLSTPATVTNFDSTIKAINEYLARWNGLRAIPQCWKALQYVLCSSFYPKCEDDGGADSPKIFLPTYDMCRAIRLPCRLVEAHFHWPEWLHCENQSLFSQKSSHCFNEYKEMKLNSMATPPTTPTITTTTTSGGVVEQAVLFRCSPPLVNTDDRGLWYPGIDGCALRCDGHPLYGEAADSRLVRTTVTYGSLLGLLVTAAGVATFYIDLNRGTRYPSRCVFYVSLCTLLSYLGWTVQQLFRRTEFTCREDNTMRVGKGGNATCFASFALIYYFSLAAMFWLVVFAYGCTVVYRPKTSSGRKPSEKLYESKNVFHFIAWFIPFIFTLIIIWLEEIDGDALFGICFVGFAKPNYFIVFVIVPVTFNLVLYTVFMTKALVGLWTCLSISAEKFTNEKQKKKRNKICYFMFRIFASIVWAVFLYILFVSVYFYQQSLTDDYNYKLNQHIICSFNITDALEPKQNDLKAALSSSTGDVRIQEISETEQLEEFGNLQQADHCAKLKPALALWPIILQVFCNFSTCILAFLWICNESAFKSWFYFFRKKLGRDCYTKTMRCLKRRTPKTTGGDHHLHQHHQQQQQQHQQSQTDNSTYKRRKLDALLPNLGMGQPYHSPTPHHWDPVEMEFSSIYGGSIYCAYSDKLYTFKAATGGNHSVGGGGSINTEANNGQQLTTAQSLSDCYANSLTQLSRSLDSISLFESQHQQQMVNKRVVRKKTKKQLGRLLSRRGSDTSDLSSSVVSASVGLGMGAPYLSRPKSRPLESPLQEKLVKLQQLQQLLQLQMHLASATASPPDAPATAASVTGATTNDFLRQSTTSALMAANLATMAPPPLPQQQPPPFFPPNQPYLSPYFPGPLPPMPPQLEQNQLLQKQQQPQQPQQPQQQQQQQQQPTRGQFSHNITSFQSGTAMSTAARPPGSLLFASAGFQHHHHNHYHQQQQAQPYLQFPAPVNFAPRAPFPAMGAPPAIRRPSAIRQSSFTFTHGYSVGGSGGGGGGGGGGISSGQTLVNPLEVKRRPDSRAVNHLVELNNNCVVQAAADCTDFYTASIAAPAQSQHSAMVEFIDLMTKQLEKEITAQGKANNHRLNYPWIINGQLYNAAIASEYFERLQQQVMSEAEYAELIRERELYKEVITNRGDSRLSSSTNLFPIICSSSSEMSILSALTRMSFNSDLKLKERKKLDQHMQKISDKATESKEVEKVKTKPAKEKHEKVKKQGKTKKSSRKTAEEQAKNPKSSVTEDSNL